MIHQSCRILRYFSDIGKNTPKICIVGAGPAGFYSAQHIVKRIKNVQVSIFEKLPVPFGLVRFGVAPDHPEVKNVISKFSSTAEHPNVEFVGNVSIGRDVTLSDLTEAYDFVLLSYGANLNRKLGITGENLLNVVPARQIVGWYNGLPEEENLKIDFSSEKVAIIGQGNVAIDVARILLKPVDDLKNTDITQHALETLMSSKIKEVHLIGRRGPLQAAFTIKELREMLKLKDCQTYWNENDFKGMEEVLPSLDRPRKRLTDLMLQSLKNQREQHANKKFFPVFYRSPLEINDGIKKTITLGVNKLEETDGGYMRASLTDSRETMQSDLIVTSVGYKAVTIDNDLPFDNKKGIVINQNGKIDNRLYATGWVATGPTGVILTTMTNAFNTAELICKEIETNKSVWDKQGYESVKNKLNKANVQVVTWADWLKIDDYEKKEGQKLGKPREKITDYQKMLQVAA